MNLLNFLIILTSVNNCLCSQFYEDKHHFDDNNISHLGRFFSINGNIQINLEIDIFDDFINPSITRLIKNIPLKFILIDYEKYQMMKKVNVINCLTMHYSLSQSIYFLAKGKEQS